MTRNYWSCSKFADWLRGTPKPLMGTTKEWNIWHKTARIKRIRYWLAEEGLDFLQNIVYCPVDLTNNIRYYFNNRWISKTHALTSNLKRGQYHDLDTRLLHALFDELANFVEVEQAWMHAICSEVEGKKYTMPFWRLKSWHSPEAGLAYLQWAAELKNNEDWKDKTDPNFGQPTPQALAAQQIMRLYIWWKEERPKRPDPMDASGWSEYYEIRRQKTAPDDDLSWIDCNPDDPEQERASQISKLCHQMEQAQDEEDTEMLIRLIKIRGHLWT